MDRELLAEFVQRLDRRVKFCADDRHRQPISTLTVTVSAVPCNG